MQKTLISTMVGLALLSAGTAGAKSIPIDIAKLHQVKASSSPVERQYDGRVSIEFTKPAGRFEDGEAQKLVAALSRAAAVPLRFERVLMKRFVVVTIEGARSDSDVLSSVGRLAGSSGILTVTPNRYVKSSSVDSFSNPGWRSQYDFYSRTQDFSGNAFVHNPRILELTKFFETIDFNDSRLSLVDSFFTDVQNLPQSTYVQKQTILDGEYSSTLVDRGNSDAHGLNMAAYLKGQPNANYGTVGMGYSTLPLLAISVFDPATNRTTDFDVAEGILYSMNLHSTANTNPNPNPAKVVNLSLGASGFTCSDSAVYQAAIDAATNAGGIIVAAAGNDGRSSLNLPANCQNVVSVGAVGFSGYLASFSNYSPSLSVSAISSTNGSNPGEGSGFIYTTGVPSGSGIQNTGVETVAGTSIAAPYISLLLTYAKAVNPALNFTEALALLKRNSDAFRQEDPKCAGMSSCGGIINPVSFVQEVSGANLLSFNAYTASGSTPPVVEEPPPATEPPTSGGTSMDPVTVAISGTASNPTSVQVFQGGSAVTVTSVQTTESSITIDFDAVGQFEVRFTATPNSNAPGISPSATAQYSFTVNTETQPATVGQVTRLDDPTTEADDNDIPAPGASASGGGGGGGGGSMSLFGLLGLGVLVGLMKRKSASVIR